ncbi:MAG: hypothetical protein WAV18_02750 [Roseiarcus sp.]
MSEVKPPKPKKHSAPLALVITALLVVIAAGAWYFLVANRPSIIATKAIARSIVVLPLRVRFESSRRIAKLS